MDCLPKSSGLWAEFVCKLSAENEAKLSKLSAEFMSKIETKFSHVARCKIALVVGSIKTKACHCNYNNIEDEDNNHLRNANVNLIQLVGKKGQDGV